MPDPVKVVDRTDLAQEAFEKGVSNGLNETANFILSKARDLIIEKEVFDTGKLSQTAGVELKEPLKKHIFFVEKYAPFMEFGTGPAAEEPQPKYMPPLEPLIAWCKRKGIRFDRDNGKQMSYRETAQYIRWHIYHYGIDPRPYLRPATAEGEHKKETLIRQEIQKAMKEAGFNATSTRN